MKGSKKIMKIVLIGIYLFMTVAGLVLMKYGKNPGSIKVADGNISFGVSFISGIGLLCYIISFVFIKSMNIHKITICSPTISFILTQRNYVQ